MLFTGKGDDGKTKVFSCDQRISKSSAVAEALGALDEINSFLGFVKVECTDSPKGFSFKGKNLGQIVRTIQENLFIIQAEVAGADKNLEEEKITEAEDLVNEIEKELPPIKTFFISGGTKLASLFDFSRTLARKAERRVVGVSEENIQKVSPQTLSYLNRLSSLLYALARLSNHLSGINEEPPTYK